MVFREVSVIEVREALRAWLDLARRPAPRTASPRASRGGHPAPSPLARSACGAEGSPWRAARTG